MDSTSTGAGGPPGDDACTVASKQELSDSLDMIAICSGLVSMVAILLGDLRTSLLALWNVHTSTCLPSSPRSSTASHCPLSEMAMSPPRSEILNSLINCEQAALRRQHMTWAFLMRESKVNGVCDVELTIAGVTPFPGSGPGGPTLSFNGSSCGWPVGQTMMRCWTVWAAAWASSTSRRTLTVPSSGCTANPRTIECTRNCDRFNFQTTRLWLRL
mmetsp:Transcript_17547/g.35806  ORF Transcript_17547/g.35806 Transcript_17547/m.35806 type:complete len:215 (-) Transcript_17547:389-1033(-)